MAKIEIKIADFTRTPGARYIEDGPFSGQEFRRKELEPLFQNKEDSTKIWVYLDGTKGYPSSFLEEAFGGLARIFGSKIVKARIIFLTKEFKYLLGKLDEFIGNYPPKNDANNA